MTTTSQLDAPAPRCLPTISRRWPRSLVLSVGNCARGFIVVYQVRGAPYDKAVYQAPNRIAEFSSPSVIVNVGIGASLYSYLQTLSGLSGGCSGWIESTLTPKATEPYDAILDALTILRSPTINVQRISLTRFQVESVFATHSPKGFPYPPGVAKFVATVRIRHGFVVDERVVTSGPAPVYNQRENVRYSAFDSSPPGDSTSCRRDAPTSCRDSVMRVIVGGLTSTR
jgi:hypothetical protein